MKLRDYGEVNVVEPDPEPVFDELTEDDSDCVEPKRMILTPEEARREKA